MRLEKSVSKMGLRSLGCWTNDPVIKKHWNFYEIFDVRGCGFFEFSKISILGLLTIVSYTVFLLGFSLWQRGIDSTKQMMVYDQITFFLKNRIFDFFLFDFGIDFWTGPDRIFFLDRTGPNFSDRLDFWTGPARTGPVHSWVLLLSQS